MTVMSADPVDSVAGRSSAPVDLRQHAQSRPAAATSTERASGFPRLEAVDDLLHLAWTEPGGGLPGGTGGRLRFATLPAAAVPAASTSAAAASTPAASTPSASAAAASAPSAPGAES